MSDWYDARKRTGIADLRPPMITKLSSAVSLLMCSPKMRALRNCLRVTGCASAIAGINIAVFKRCSVEGIYLALLTIILPIASKERP